MALNSERLRQLRSDKGWSQAQTARRAGINQSYYCSLENGRQTNPSSNTITKIADAFGVSDVSEIVA